jgi:hypothetical protein
MGNGNIPAAVITGGKDPGSRPGRVILGNQDIGKIIIKVTNGTKGAGKNDMIPRKTEKPLLGAGAFTIKSD